MGAFLFFAALLIIATLVRRIVRSISAKWRARRVLRSEASAGSLLRARGFSIVAKNTQHTWQFSVDGEPTTVALRPDFVVEKGGRRWVADAKSGTRAPDILFPPTRRQLLEYAHAFGATGVLLVDTEAKEIHTVCFAPMAAVRADRLLAQTVGAMTLSLGGVLAWLVV